MLRMIERGITATELCDQLGHSNPGVTERRYIHLFNRDWAEAVRVFEVAAAKLGPMRDLKRTAMIYGDLGWAYRELGNPELATRYAQKSIAIHDMLRDRYSASMAEDSLARALLKLDRLDAAEQHLNRSLDLLNEIGREHGKGNVLLSVAELDLARGRVGEARTAAEEGLELASRMGERPHESGGHSRCIMALRLRNARGDRPGRRLLPVRCQMPVCPACALWSVAR